MKKILFIALNSSWSQSNLALYYMRELIRDLDFDAHILSFTLKEPLHQVMEEIYAKHPDVICLSAYIWNRIYLSSLQPELAKILPHARFVVGGPEALAFSHAPRTTVLSGPGEAAFRVLALQGFPAISSLAHAEHLELRDIPFPYHPEDVAQLTDHLIYYECYRGCPYSCVYCLSSCDHRNEPRFDLSRAEDQQKLQQELLALVELEPRTLKFIDRSFNIQKDLAHAIWRFAIEQDLAFDLHFEIYPDLIQEADIELLALAPEGRIRFEVGIQSTNDEVLRTCGRNSDWQKSRTVLMALKHRTKVRVHADLLVGLPGEDFSSIIKSLNDLCLCEPAAVQLGMLKILPNTPMQNIAYERGYLWMDIPPYQILSTDSMRYEDLCLLDDYAHLLSLYWNKEEHPHTWHSLLQRHPANRILQELRDMHLQQGMPLYSVSRQKREMMMQALTGKLLG